MATVLTIGELLWDVFPDGRHLGGAPANVAFHLAEAGHRARLASAIGDDALGQEALRLLEAGGVDTELVARDPTRPTGTVQVTVGAGGVPTFDIRRDVAWDAIPVSEPLLAAARQADAIVFGTLAQRAAPSRATIQAVVATAGSARRVLDLNLRPPFVEAGTVARSLELTTILKLNEDEAAQLPGLLGRLPPAAAGQEIAGAGPDAAALHAIAAACGLRRIYVTRGAAGAALLEAGRRLAAPAPRVAVADTVGAGDAFTAALLDGELRGLDAATILRHAVAAGAFVASRAGAMPRWPADLRAALELG